MRSDEPVQSARKLWALADDNRNKSGTSAYHWQEAWYWAASLVAGFYEDSEDEEIQVGAVYIECSNAQRYEREVTR